MSGFSEFADRLKYSSIRLPSSVEERKKLYSFFAIFLFFVFAAFYSMGNFVWLKNYSSDDKLLGKAISGPSQEVTDEIALITKMSEAYGRYRAESEQLIAVGEAVGRSPVAMMADDAVSGDALASVNIIPAVTIKALIILDGGGAATLDIDDEAPGQIFRVGSVFGNGKGRVTAIDAKGVSWTWTNEKHRTDL